MGDIEWYHRLRNQLYHQGNGLTVERNKVEVYAELANNLFRNLFGFRLLEPQDDETKLLGEFMLAWTEFEKVVNDTAQSHKIIQSRFPLKFVETTHKLEEAGIISKAESLEIENYRKIRNEVVHGTKNYNEVLKTTIVDRLIALKNGLLSTPKKFLKFEIISNTPLVRDQEGISIEYHGQKMSNAHSLEIKVINSGNIPIRSEDFIEPIRLVFPPETTILDSSVNYVSPPSLKIDLKTERHTVTLSPFLLNPRDQFILKLMASNFNLNSKGTPFNFEGKISGIERLDLLAG